MAQVKKGGLAYLTVIYMIGNFGSKILSFILVFFMTYYLTREEVGEYDLILTSVSFIVPCVSMQIDSSLLRWLLDKDFADKNDFLFRNAFGFLFRNLVVFTLIYWCVGFFINWPNKSYVYIFSVLMMIMPLVQQGTRGIGKNMFYASIGVVYSLLFVFNTVVVLVIFKGGVDYVLLANIFALVAVIIWVVSKNKWWQYFKYYKLDRNIVSEFCKYSLPLLPNTLSWWLIGSSTRYVILAFLGKEYNGIFAIAYKYPTIVLVLTSVFTLAWQEQVIKAVKNVDAEKEASKTLIKYVTLILCLIIILTVCSKFLMSFVDKSYYDAWRYIPVLLYAVFLQAIAGFYGAGYLRYRKTTGIFISSILGGLVTIGAAFILVNKYGLYGISFSILIGYLTLLIFRMVHIKKFMNITFPFKRTVILSVLFVLAIFSLYINNVWIFPTALICAVLIFLTFNIEDIKSIIKKIKTKNI